MEEVQRNRDRLLADVEKAQNKDRKGLPGVEPSLIAAQVQIEGEASNRITELKQAAASLRTTGDAAAPAPVDLSLIHI